MQHYLFKKGRKFHNTFMEELDSIKEIIRNLLSYCGDHYLYEIQREKLQKKMRHQETALCNAIENNEFNYDEVMEIASSLPEYVSLTGEKALIDAISIWIEKNRENFNTREIELYVQEAKKMYSSLFI